MRRDIVPGKGTHAILRRLIHADGAHDGEVLGEQLPERAESGRLGHEVRDPAVAYDERLARGRRRRVDGNVGSAGLHDPVQRHAGGQPLAGVNPDAIAAPHPLRAQQPGKAIAALGEGRVRERRPHVAQRLLVGIAQRGAVDGVGEEKQHARQSPSSRATMLRWMSDVPAYSTPPIASRRSRSTPDSLR